MSWDKEIEEIARKRALAAAQGGAEAVQKQHAKGLLTVRERLERLFDPGSFAEIGPAAGGAERTEDGTLTGFTPANFILGIGAVDGRRVVGGGEDFTLKGGSPNEAGLRKSVYAEELALQYRLPLVRLHEGGGGSVAGTGSKTVGAPVYAPPRFRSVARALRTVPVASAALGPVAGMPASRLVASHFTVMTEETAQVMVAGPAVVRRALGLETTKEALGGAEVHTRNGVVDNLAADEDDALAQIRRFLSYLPANVDEPPPAVACDDPADRREAMLADVVPRDRRKVYDMRRILEAVLERGSVFEMGRRHGPSLITALARLGGAPVGVLANDCRIYAGAMTAAAAQKTRRFVELCATFHLPVVAFVDEPGFMIGPDAEAAATIRHGTDAVLAVADFPGPWASVLVRKSFGVASAAHYGPGAYLLAWPSGETGALPVEGGVEVAFGRRIAEAEDPEAMRAELEAKLAAAQAPGPRAESFAFHDLIDPRDTRPRLCDWMGWLDPRLRAWVAG